MATTLWRAVWRKTGSVYTHGDVRANTASEARARIKALTGDPLPKGVTDIKVKETAGAK